MTTSIFRPLFPPMMRHTRPPLLRAKRNGVIAMGRVTRSAHEGTGFVENMNAKKRMASPAVLITAGAAGLLFVVGAIYQRLASSPHALVELDDDDDDNNDDYNGLHAVVRNGAAAAPTWRSGGATLPAASSFSLGRSRAQMATTPLRGATGKTTAPGSLDTLAAELAGFASRMNALRQDMEAAQAQRRRRRQQGAPPLAGQAVVAIPGQGHSAEGGGFMLILSFTNLSSYLS